MAPLGTPALALRVVETFRLVDGSTGGAYGRAAVAL